MAQSKIIITNENIETAGAVTYWRLSGETDLSRLSALWVAAGLDEKSLPSAPSEKLALSRALRDNESTKHKLVKAAGGWWAMLATNSNNQGDVATTQLLKARYFEGRAEIVATDNVTDLVRYDVNNMIHAIRRAFTAHAETLAASDVSIWLINLAETQKATSLRESGGVYFLPRNAVDYWAKVAEVLKGCGHQVFAIPALRTEEAIAAILDGITHEAESACAALHAEMSQPLESLPGTRAMNTKIASCETLAAKVSEYEALLDLDLGALQAKIARVASIVRAKREQVANAGSMLAGSSVAGTLSNLADAFS